VLPNDGQTHAGVQLHTHLREPALQSDWGAWLRAWQTVDAEVLAPLVAQAQAGGTVPVTLCGEKGWKTFGYDPLVQQAGSLWQRVQGLWRKPAETRLDSVLEAL